MAKISKNRVISITKGSIINGFEFIEFILKEKVAHSHKGVFRCTCGLLFNDCISRVMRGVSKGCGCKNKSYRRGPGNVRNFDLKEGDFASGFKFLRYSPNRNKARIGVFLCICGSEFEAVASLMVKGTGRVRGCGCVIKGEGFQKRESTKGLRGSEYNSWQSAKKRCYFVAGEHYESYGKRGIVMAEEWRVSFPQFLKDMGRKPSSKHTLERLNVNGNYEKSNCVWATPKEQANNKRYHHYLTINGVTKNIMQWSETSGNTFALISGRIKNGWDAKEAVFKPVDKRFSNNMKKVTTILLFILFFKAGYSQCNSNPPQKYFISQTSAPGEIYRPNLAEMGVLGGDTLVITGTNYSVIEFFNSAGDICRPIVVMPQTKLTTGAFRFTGNSRYIRVLGGDSLYGIKVVGGAFSITEANHIYAENIECANGSIGIFARLDPDKNNTASWYPNYTITKLTFNKFYIHDQSGEGTYIGNTSNAYVIKSPTSGLDTLVTAVRLDSVSVTNSVILRCGWDGLQIANAKDNCIISGNTIMDVGLLNASAQKAGILMGTNTSGNIFNNIVRRAAGNGIQCFGYGNMKIYGNTVDSCGFSDEVVNGEQSIYGADYQYAYEGGSLPDQSIEFYNNYIRFPQARGAISFFEINGRSGTMNVHDNTFCIPNAQQNWQSTYFTFPHAFGNTNNILYCEQPCNCAITNILRSGKYIN